MNCEIRNTFLHFDDGVATSGHAARLRSSSAHSRPSASHSETSSITSSSSLPHGQNTSSSGNSTPDVFRSSRTKHPPGAHIVWDTPSEESSSESIASSTLFGELVRTRRPSRELKFEDMHSAQFNRTAEGNGSSMPGDDAPAAREFRDDGGHVSGTPKQDSARNNGEDRQEHPSLGSAKHASQTCKPCHFLLSKLGCKHGELCPFCHYMHSKRSKSDLTWSKPQRDLCLRLVTMLHQGVPGSKEKADAEEHLLKWMTSGNTRIAVFAVKAISGFQGQSNDKPGVERFLRMAAAQNQGEIVESQIADDERPTIGSMLRHATEANGDRSEASVSWTRVSL